MTQARAKGLAAHHHQPPTGALAVCTGELLAWADHERGLHVHRLRGSGGGGGRSSSSSSAGGSNSSSLLPVARCALTAVVGCLAWHRAASGAWQLLSGDADGQVCVWQLPPEPSSSSSSSAAREGRFLASTFAMIHATGFTSKLTSGFEAIAPPKYQASNSQYGEVKDVIEEKPPEYED